MSSSPVILYRYDASPYARKIDNVLALKNVPHNKVNVSSMLPRPEITDLLGITYRRIPILAIGNDVYCDTSLIVSVLERRFPTSAGYSTIFPRSKRGGSRDTGATKIFSKLFVAALFPVATAFIAWEKLPQAFIQDRSALFGTPIDVSQVVATREKSITTVSAYLSLLEEQFKDDREWLFDTEQPSLGDISVQMILNTLRFSPPGKRLLDGASFPNTAKWLARVSTFIEGKRASQAAPQPITGDQAAATIMSSAFESYDVVGFDANEAGRLGLKLHDQVQIAPDDTGKDYPTVGKLVAMNSEEVVIEVQGAERLLRCHFPQIGFTVRGMQSHKL